MRVNLEVSQSSTCVDVVYARLLEFVGEKAAEKTAEEPASSLLCYKSLNYAL